MDEVDGIILLNLRQIGCEIPEAKDRIGDFDMDTLVRTCSHCLKVIGQNDFPSYADGGLPTSMSERFKVGTALGDAITRLGFREEVTFQHFLYPSPDKSRSILSFLVTQLPKAEDQEEDTIGGSALLISNIVSEIGRARAMQFIPHVARPVSLARCIQTRQRSGRPFMRVHAVPLAIVAAKPKTQEEEKYVSKYLPFITQQVADPHMVGPSVFERNTNAVAEAADNERLWNSLVEGGKTAAEVKKAQREAFARLIADALRRRGGNVRGNAQGASASSGGQLQSLQEIMAEIAGAVGGNAMGDTAFTRQTKFTHDDDDDVDTEAGISREELARMSREERQRAREERERLAREKRQRELEERENEYRQSQEAELAQLEGQIAKGRATLEHLEHEIELHTANLRQLEEKISTESHTNETLMEEYKIKHKTIGLLKDRDASLAELRALSAASGRRLVELAAQWETHRVPLIEKIRSHKEAITQRKEDLKWKIERIKEMRDEMKRLVQDIRERDELVKALLEELNKLPKNIQRGGYTRRIMEIMKNIEKQKIDIDKILGDTRAMQKEMNTNIETLNRSFAATDELIYRDATHKGDAASKRCYKLLIASHEGFGKLTACVEETGAVETQIRDLEAKMEQAQLRANVLNMDRVAADLKQIKMENAAIQKKLGNLAAE